MSFGFISTLWAAASGMGAAMRGINKALCQKDTRPFWVAIPLSIAFTLLVAVLIILYFVLLIFGKQIGNWLLQIRMPNLSLQIWHIFRHLIAILMMTLVLPSCTGIAPVKDSLA